MAKKSYFRNSDFEIPALSFISEKPVPNNINATNESRVGKIGGKEQNLARATVKTGKFHSSQP